MYALISIFQAIFPVAISSASRGFRPLLIEAVQATFDGVQSHPNLPCKLFRSEWNKWWSDGEMYLQFSNFERFSSMIAFSSSNYRQYLSELIALLLDKSSKRTVPFQYSKRSMTFFGSPQASQLFKNGSICMYVYFFRLIAKKLLGLQDFFR